MKIVEYSTTMKLQLFSVFVLQSIALLRAQTSNEGIIAVSSDTQLSIVDDFANANTGMFVNNGETFIYANFVNNGMVDYTSAGLIRLEGNDDQMVVGHEPIYAYNLLVNNTSGLGNAVDIAGTLSVAGQIDFNQGIVNTLNNNGQFILENEGVAINTSNDSFVDGFIEKQGSDSFEFPIGDEGFFRYAEISAPASTTAVYKGRYVFQDPDDSFPAQFRIGNSFLFNNEEYWIIENTQGSEQVRVTLSWDQNTTPLQVISPPEESITMARWDFQEGAWTPAGGTVNELNRTISALQTIDGRAVFTIARKDPSIVLPEGVIVWTAVSPNGDGKNDYLVIENIDALPNNTLEIYNRWGYLVFETTNYGSNDNVFRGVSIGQDRLLPSGTYFYVLKFDDLSSGSAQRADTSGFLYLSTD